MTEKQQMYESFASTLILKQLQPVQIAFERTGDPNPANPQFQTSWTMKFRNDDPVINKDKDDENRKIIEFRPLYEITVKSGDTVIYHHQTIFILSYSIPDTDIFKTIWTDNETKPVFTNQNIGKVLWPFIRQQVADGLCRMMLPGVLLPLMI